MNENELNYVYSNKKEIDSYYTFGLYLSEWKLTKQLSGKTGELENFISENPCILVYKDKTEAKYIFYDIILPLLRLMKDDRERVNEMLRKLGLPEV